MPERTQEQPDSIRPTEAEATVEKVRNTVSATAGKAQAKVEQVAGAVRDTIDENRAPAADKLEDVASRLHDRAESIPGGETVGNLAHGAAQILQATAQYIREHAVRDMTADVENLVRKYPSQSLLMAFAVGFLVGRTFTSDD